MICENQSQALSGATKFVSHPSWHSSYEFLQTQKKSENHQGTQTCNETSLFGHSCTLDDHDGLTPIRFLQDHSRRSCIDLIPAPGISQLRLPAARPSESATHDGHARHRKPLLSVPGTVASIHQTPSTLVDLLLLDKVPFNISFS